MRDRLDLNERPVLQEPNLVLDSTRRRENLISVYSKIPGLENETGNVINLISRIHGMVMAGADMSKIQGLKVKITSDELRALVDKQRPGVFRSVEFTKAFNFVTAVRGMLRTDGGRWFEANIPLPREELLPDLLEAYASKYNELIQIGKSDVQKVKTAAFLSHVLTYIHPVYEGIGRVARVMFTIALVNQGGEKLILESQNAETRAETIDFTTNFLLNLYRQNIDLLPQYIQDQIKTGKHNIAPDEILSLPDYLDADEAKLDKQKSLEALLQRVIGSADMQMIESLIDEKEVTVYMDEGRRNNRSFNF